MARAILDELEQAAAHRYVPPHCMTYIYAGLNDVERALDWEAKACRRWRLTILLRLSAHRESPRAPAAHGLHAPNGVEIRSSHPDISPARMPAVQNAPLESAWAGSRQAERAASLQPAIRDCRKQIFEARRRERFGEVTVAPGFPCFPPVLFLPPSSHGSDMDVMELRQSSQRSRNGIAVHHRQANVQEDEVRCELSRSGDSGRAIVGQPGDVAEPRHRQFQHLRSIHVVLDDQHPKGGPRRDRRLFGRHACRDRHRRHWQTNFDLRPLTSPRTSHVDLPFVHLHEPPR